MEQHANIVKALDKVDEFLAGEQEEEEEKKEMKGEYERES